MRPTKCFLVDSKIRSMMYLYVCQTMFRFILPQSFLHFFSNCSTFKCVIFLFQVVLLSATMPNEVLEVTNRFMNDPIRILVKKEELTLEGIRQFYIDIKKEVDIYSKFFQLRFNQSIDFFLILRKNNSYLFVIIW